MNCEIAKKIDLINFLNTKGLKPLKIDGDNHWFLSPFRNENTPSFKVSLNKNLWYDFGEGVGGNIIDLIIELDNCSVKEALEKLQQKSFSFDQQTKIYKTKNNYSILKITELSNLNLLNYIDERKINLHFAKKYCLQIHYAFENKNEYYGIGFKNNSGGFEIRSKYFKGCLGKKEITWIKNECDVVSVYESWSDFLSHLTLKINHRDEDYVILNSTSLIKKSLENLKKYQTVNLYLDNDNAGDNATKFLSNNLKSVIFDQRVFYKEYKDINDFLIRSQ